MVARSTVVTQGAERRGGGHLARQPVGLGDELGGPLELVVALLGLVALLRQRLGAPGLGQVGLLSRQLDVEPARRAWASAQLRPVGLEARQALLARDELALEPDDLVAHGLQQPGVLLALGAIAMDGRVELPLRPGGAPICAADRLLETVRHGRLLGSGHVRELGVADGRGDPEERLAGHARELGDVLRDEAVISDRLAVGHQLGLALGTREALHQPTRRPSASSSTVTSGAAAAPQRTAWRTSSRFESAFR